MWIQTGVRVRKRLSWVLTSVTLTFDLWPWPFAWTSLLTMVITPENFMMIRWWEHSKKGVTDRRTDRQTDGRTENTICRAAWSQLKMVKWKKYWTEVIWLSILFQPNSGLDVIRCSSLSEEITNWTKTTRKTKICKYQFYMKWGFMWIYLVWIIMLNSGYKVAWEKLLSKILHFPCGSL